MKIDLPANMPSSQMVLDGCPRTIYKVLVGIRDAWVLRNEYRSRVVHTCNLSQGFLDLVAKYQRIVFERRSAYMRKQVSSDEGVVCQIDSLETVWQNYAFGNTLQHALQKYGLPDASGPDGGVASSSSQGVHAPLVVDTSGKPSTVTAIVPFGKSAAAKQKQQTSAKGKAQAGAQASGSQVALRRAIHGEDAAEGQEDIGEETSLVQRLPSTIRMVAEPKKSSRVYVRKEKIEQDNTASQWCQPGIFKKARRTLSRHESLSTQQDDFALAIWPDDDRNIFSVASSLRSTHAGSNCLT